MGWTSQVARQVIIDGSGTGDGLYDYDGTPALGNLIASIVAVGGVDDLGNTVYQGIWAYNANGAALGLAPTGGQAQLHLHPAGAAHSTEDGLSYCGAANAGAANENQYLIVTSGRSGGNDDAGLVLNGESADATVPASAYMDLGGFVAMTWTRTAVTVASGSPLAVYGETWHPMTLANGWTVSSTGFAQYRLDPDGYVSVRAAGLTPGTTADGTALWTAPAGYVTTFSGTMSFPVVVGYTTAPTSPPPTPEVTVRNTGEIQWYNLRGTLSTVAFTFRYPLD